MPNVHHRRRLLLERVPIIDWPGRTYPNRPETFSRASTAYKVDSLGSLVSVASGAKRGGHFVTDNTSIVRQTTLLEQAYTNLVTSDALTAWTVVGTPVITPNIDDPTGGTGAYRVADNDAGVREYIYRSLTFTGDGTKSCVFCVLEAVSSPTGQVFALYDSTASVLRYNGVLTWSAGVPTLTSITGTTLAYAALGGGWYRISVQVPSVVAANSHQVGVYPTLPTASLQGSIDVWRVNAFDSPIPLTAGWLNASSSQAVDICTLTFPSEIREMSGMVEFVGLGSGAITNARVFHIGAADGSDPLLRIRRSAANQFAVELLNAAATTSTSGDLTAYTANDSLGIWWWLQKVGSQMRINARQRIGAGAWSTNAAGDLVDIDQSTWSAATYAINGMSDGTLAGVAGHRRHRVYPGYVPAEAF